MVDDSGDSPSMDTEEDGIHTEIKTDVQYEERGKIVAVQTVKRGGRRLDWWIGFEDGSFAEAHDLYFNGELLHRPDGLESIPEWPSGKLNDENEFFPLEELTISGDGDVQREYGSAQDGGEIAVQIIEAEDPEIILEEWWEEMKEMYDAGTL